MVRSGEGNKETRGWEVKRVSGHSIATKERSMIKANDPALKLASLFCRRFLSKGISSTMLHVVDYSLLQFMHLKSNRAPFNTIFPIDS